MYLIENMSVIYKKDETHIRNKYPDLSWRHKANIHIWEAVLCFFPYLLANDLK